MIQRQSARHIDGLCIDYRRSIVLNNDCPRTGCTGKQAGYPHLIRQVDIGCIKSGTHPGTVSWGIFFIGFNLVMAWAAIRPAYQYLKWVNGFVAIGIQKNAGLRPALWWRHGFQNRHGKGTGGRIACLIRCFPDTYRGPGRKWAAGCKSI